MKDTLKRKFVFVIIISLISILNINFLMSTTKADVSIHTTKIYAIMDVGDELKLGVDTDSADIKWTSDKKSVVTVSSKGIIEARKEGKATVTANVNKESYSFVIEVAHNKAVPTPSPIPTKSPTPTPAPSPTPIIQNSQDDKSITVYVTKTGSKYHRSSCRYLSKSRISISLSEAKKYYSPCSVCNPPQ